MMLQHMKEYEMEEAKAKAKAEAPVPYKQPDRYRDGVPVEGVQATVVLIAEIHLVLRKVEDYCRNPRLALSERKSQNSPPAFAGPAWAVAGRRGPRGMGGGAGSQE